MNACELQQLPGLLDLLGLEEEPLGLFYTDQEPAEGASPKPSELPTREKEAQNAIDWQAVFKDFSCALRHIWRARKKKTAAYFSADQFGCPGAAFWMGFNKPQAETILRYVSTGIPGWTIGERYCDSPEALQRAFDLADPIPAPRKFCVVKPLSRFDDTEDPDFVLFFTRPEALGGLHQLAFFVTNDPEVVASPWSAACGSIAAWPLHFREQGQNKAVLGGWDPSARKYFRKDELSFTIPFQMFQQMLQRYPESFLMTHAWANTRKRITT